MYRTMRLSLFLLSLLISISCQEKRQSAVKKDMLMGVWEAPVRQDSILSFTRGISPLGNEYSIEFKENNQLVERKNSGGCATPPIVYADFTGKWEKKEAKLTIAVNYWGGLANYSWELVSVDNKKLVVRIIKEEYQHEDNSHR